MGLLRSEIDEKIKNAYRVRLTQKVRALRRRFSQRDWQGLKNECMRIQSSADEFGFQLLSERARSAYEAIPPKATPRSHLRPISKKTLEILFATIDEMTILSETQVQEYARGMGTHGKERNII